MEGIAKMGTVEIAVAIAAYSALEYWLGKTDKVKAGSALEAGLLGLKYVLGVIVRDKGKK